MATLIVRRVGGVFLLIIEAGILLFLVSIYLALVYIGVSTADNLYAWISVVLIILLPIHPHVTDILTAILRNCRMVIKSW